MQSANGEGCVYAMHSLHDHQMKLLKSCQIPNVNSSEWIKTVLEVTYGAFTETGATQTMKTNQKAELKQWIPNIFKSSQSNAQYKTMISQLVR